VRAKPTNVTETSGDLSACRHNSFDVGRRMRYFTRRAALANYRYSGADEASVTIGVFFPGN
jgi:hypothetical protein